MWDNEDDCVSDDVSGNDVTNNNYRMRRGQGVQRFTNVGLPCVLFFDTEGDSLNVDADDRRSPSKRIFNIEIREDGNEFLEQSIPVTCKTIPEQVFGKVTHKYIDHVIQAYEGTDVQKMGYMIKFVKGIEDMLHSVFAFDQECRLQEQFKYVEDKLHSDIAELKKCLGNIRDVISRAEKCPKIKVKGDSETSDHDTQTDIQSVCLREEDGEKSRLSIPPTDVFTTVTGNSDSDDVTDEDTCLESQYSDNITIADESTAKETASMFDGTDLQEGYGTGNEETFTSNMNSANLTSQTSIETSHEDEWKIDPTAWLSCLNLKDDTQIRTLLKERKLPNQAMLDKACSVFGTQSPIISEICASICKYLREKAENIQDVWPAYFYDKNEKTKGVEIIFVVIKANQSKLGIGNLYRINEREAFVCSHESQNINKIEYDSRIDFTDLSKLTNCINENSVTLMREHSKLTIVSATTKKSSGYNSDTWKVLDRQCVTLYVHIKGFIPLQEKPFPEELGGYPVDVREAVFKKFVGGRPYEYHEHLRMGCAIRGSMVDYDRHLLAGTLGGFLQHPKHGLCCITCGHVLCHDLNNIPSKENIHWTDEKQYVPVFQPVSRGSPSFGHLVSLVYNSGGLGDSGVDVALIKVTSRFPMDGRFPDTDRNHETGFTEGKQMTYNSGKICEIEKLNTNSVVIKYGRSTEITRGVFRLQGGAVRTSHSFGEHGSGDFLLHNQIEILSAGEHIFAVNGDSGAFVFIEENGELSLVGMLEGGCGDGRFIVTPMKDILKALGLPIEGSLKTFGKDNVLLSPPPESPSVIFRSSTPKPFRPFSSSRTDSAISMNTSVSEDNSALLSLVEEKLKNTNDSISKEVAKQVSEIKTEISENMDDKLIMLKTELKQEIQQGMQQQAEILTQLLSRVAMPQKV